jgi:hypothetical protein
MTLADEQCSTRPTVQQEDAAEHVPLQRAVGPSLQGNGNADPPACQATTTQPCSSIAAHQQHQLSLGDPVSVKAQTELAWISSFDPPPQYEGRWQVGRPIASQTRSRAPDTVPPSEDLCHHGQSDSMSHLQVRYADGKTRWCRPAHIRPVYPVSKPQQHRRHNADDKHCPSWSTSTCAFVCCRHGGVCWCAPQPGSIEQQ